MSSIPSGFPSPLMPLLPMGLPCASSYNSAGGSAAHFELAAGQTSIAVTHRTVEEIWFFLNGRGEMWRKLNDCEEVVTVDAGVCITIPLGTHFQFRSLAGSPLAAIAITMPPWPGGDEAFAVDGKWTPSVKATAPAAS